MLNGVVLIPKRLLSKPNPQHRGPCNPELGLAKLQLMTHSQMPVASVPNTTLPMKIPYTQKCKRPKTTKKKKNLPSVC